MLRFQLPGIKTMPYGKVSRFVSPMVAIDPFEIGLIDSAPSSDDSGASFIPAKKVLIFKILLMQLISINFIDGL